MKILIYSIFISAFLSSCGFIRYQPKKILKKAQSSAPYDAVIVPGHPYDGESWTTTMNYRMAWSVYLYKNGLTKNIIYSGSSVYTEYVEAKVMAKYAIEMGIPAEHIFLDTNAEHSTENVYYSYLVAKKNGFERIALATDPFQNKSLKSFIKKHELPIDQFPAVFDTIGVPSKFEPQIDPTSAINQAFISIKKRETFFQRLAGTFGRNINWYEEDLPNEQLVLKYEKDGRLIRTSYTVQNVYNSKTTAAPMLGNAR